MTNGKIDRKWFVLIWVALILACFMRGAYDIYNYVSHIEEVTRLSIVIAIAHVVLSDGVVPAAVTFICALVVWQIGYSRYVRCISRNDFCYTVMAFAAAVKFFVGLIEVFAILEPNVEAFTSNVLDPALMTGAMLAMFFFVIVRRYKVNPVEKYNAYKMWATIYMIVAGLGVLGQSGLVLMLSDGSELSLNILMQLYTMGYYIDITELQIAMSITALCVYAAYLVLVIVLGERLRRQADKFRNPETRGEFFEQYDNRAYTVREDADRVFGGDGFDNRNDSKNDNVFDEFDL